MPHPILEAIKKLVKQSQTLVDSYPELATLDFENKAAIQSFIKKHEAEFKKNQTEKPEEDANNIRKAKHLKVEFNKWLDEQIAQLSKYVDNEEEMNYGKLLKTVKEIAKDDNALIKEVFTEIQSAIPKDLHGGVNGISLIVTEVLEKYKSKKDFFYLNFFIKNRRTYRNDAQNSFYAELSKFQMTQLIENHLETVANKEKAREEEIKRRDEKIASVEDKTENTSKKVAVLEDKAQSTSEALDEQGKAIDSLKEEQLAQAQKNEAQDKELAKHGNKIHNMQKELIENSDFIKSNKSKIENLPDFSLVFSHGIDRFSGELMLDIDFQCGYDGLPKIKQIKPRGFTLTTTNVKLMNFKLDSLGAINKTAEGYEQNFTLKFLKSVTSSEIREQNEFATNLARYAFVGGAAILSVLAILAAPPSGGSSLVAAYSLGSIALGVGGTFVEDDNKIITNEYSQHRKIEYKLSYNRTTQAIIIQPLSIEI